MLIMRLRPLNKSNKIDVIHFWKLNDNPGSLTPTNDMGKWHNLRVQVTHSCAYRIVKNDNFLKCAINLLNCSCHPHDGGCSYPIHRTGLVTSYNLKLQITKEPKTQRCDKGIGRVLVTQVSQADRGQIECGLEARLSIRCEREGGVS